MNAACFKIAAKSDAPPIVKQAMERMAQHLSQPPVPVMSQEEFEQLPRWKKTILICNMPGCGKVVSTHGLLCVEHKHEMAGYSLYSSPPEDCSES